MKKLVSILFTLVPLLAFTIEPPIEPNDGLDNIACHSHSDSHKHHHHKGRKGPTGPRGPIGPTGPTGPTGGHFTIPVPDDLLAATVLVPTGVFPSSDGNTITPFVSTPDGVVFEGAPTPISALPTTLTFPFVSPVVEGTYIYGLLVNSDNSIIISAQTLPVIITSSAAPASANTVNIFIPEFTLTTPQAQFGAAFVYNPPAMPD